jgi:hypothetical protein
MIETFLIVAYGLGSFGAGYYLGHRGLAGVKSDLNDAKIDIEKLKVKTDPSAPIT